MKTTEAVDTPKGISASSSESTCFVKKSIMGIAAAGTVATAPGVAEGAAAAPATSDEAVVEERGFELGKVVADETHPAPWLHAGETQWSYWGGGKVGGKPAWLDPRSLPTYDQLRCSCGSPMALVLQVYSPLDDDEGEGKHAGGTKSNKAFHRSLYLFACRHGECIAKGKGLRVLRCQLPQHNDFYPASADEDDDDGDDPDGTGNHVLERQADWPLLCAVCGCRGGKKCGQCKGVSYCSREHQRLHWKVHKHTCAAMIQRGTGKGGKSIIGQEEETEKEPSPGAECSPNVNTKEKIQGVRVDDASTVPLNDGRGQSERREKEGASGEGGMEEWANAGKKDSGKTVNFTWPQFELIIESEPTEEERTSAALGKVKGAQLKEYMNQADEMKADDLTEKDVKEIAEAGGRKAFDDEDMIVFQARASAAPWQVLRYVRWPAENECIVNTEDEDAVGGDSKGLHAVLWAGKKGKLESVDQIPPCQHCGAERCFEFQVISMIRLSWVYHISVHFCYALPFCFPVVFACFALFLVSSFPHVFLFLISYSVE